MKKDMFTRAAALGLVLNFTFGAHVALAESGFGAGVGHNSVTQQITTYPENQMKTDGDDSGSLLSPIGGSQGSSSSEPKKEMKSASQTPVVVEFFKTGGNPDENKRYYGNLNMRAEYFKNDKGESVFGGTANLTGGYQIIGAKPANGTDSKASFGVHVGAEPNLAFHANSGIVNDVKQNLARHYIEQNGYNPDSPEVQKFVKDQYGVEIEKQTPKREHFIQFTPMASVGAELMTQACRFLLAARVGGGVGTLGEPGTSWAYGAGAYANCRYVNVSADATRLTTGSGPVDMANGDLRVSIPLGSAVPFKLGLGVRAEAIVSHDGYKSAGVVPTPGATSPTDRVETRGFLTGTIAF